jgi:hypothetical protein
MQLGTRWSVGAQPPARLSPEMCAAIRAVEGDLLGFDTTQWRWTLTWLEGRPIVELDDGTRIRLTGDGTIVTESADSTEG